MSKYREGVSLGFAEGQHVGFLEAYAQFRAGFKEGYYVTFWTAYERAQADFRRDMTEAMAAAAIQAGLPTPQQASLSLIASPVTPVTDRLEGRRRASAKPGMPNAINATRAPPLAMLVCCDSSASFRSHL